MELDEQYDKIYRYCFFRLRNRELAEDVTQETFLRYFRHTPCLSHGKPLAYLYTIAKNLCVDEAKRLKPAPLDAIPETAENTGDTSMELETGIAVRQAVQTLPPEQQELVMLRFSNGLGMGEIAAFTGLSRFAVRRRLQAAVNYLKTILREEDFT